MSLYFDFDLSPKSLFAGLLAGREGGGIAGNAETEPGGLLDPRLAGPAGTRANFPRHILGPGNRGNVTLKVQDASFFSENPAV